MKNTTLKFVTCILIMHLTSPFSVLGLGQQNGLWTSVGNDTLKTYRVVVINNSETVKGTVKADSLSVLGGARINGPLHIGTNSLTLLGLGSTTSDDITSDNGEILFGGDPDFTDIKVGIGTTYTPTEALDVYGSVALNGYRVLSSPDIGNIFVGHEAGVANILGSNNTFTGWRAGFSNTGGDNNCFFGHDAGHDNTNGSYE